MMKHSQGPLQQYHWYVVYSLYNQLVEGYDHLYNLELADKDHTSKRLDVDSLDLIFIGNWSWYESHVVQ